MASSPSFSAPSERAQTPDIPELPVDATPEEKDAHWFRHVYQGDRMPQLTVRAVAMGAILGMLMAASNLYTTLAIGWAFGVAITACVMSFVIWNAVRIVAGRLLVRLVVCLAGAALIGMTWVKWYPAWDTSFQSMMPEFAAIGAVGAAALLTLATIAVVALLWGKRSNMSILENNCMQSTASAAGYSTGATMATMFGALLLLQVPAEGQTSADIKSMSIQPIWVVALFTLATGLLGVFLAIPLKRQMINHEQLRFPSGTAAAETLRSLYSESAEAMRKAYVLISGIFVGLFVGILNTPEGILGFLDKFFVKVESIVGFTPRLPEQIPHEGIFQIAGKQPQAFGFESSVLLIAAGVITRMRVCLSMFAASCLLYFYVGPKLVEIDQNTPGTGWINTAEGLAYDKAAIAEGVIRNIDLNNAGTVLRFTNWALWGGTAVMVFASLTAVALQWKTIVRAFTGLGAERGTHESAAMSKIEVPTWWMIVGLIPITLALLFVQVVAFHIHWWAGLIAVALSFFLALVASRATGETDTTPIGAMGKVMQLLFAVLHPGQIVPNLASAGVAANSAIGSADLLTDLKSGYILGANPRKQFLAQFIGTFFGTIAIVPVWFLMIPDQAALERFAAPSTRQWEAVARVLTKGIEFLPDSAKWAILIGAAVGVILPIVERFTPPALRKYLPSAMGLGLAWVIPFSSAIGFFIGAVVGWLWEIFHKRSATMYAIALASGLIAGESLIKAVIAMTRTAIDLFGGGAGPA